MPRLLERTGTAATGSITGLYTVLVEGDDFNEPVADATRSILDGHLVLSRALAHARHYPAIDVLHSVSRVRDSVISSSHREAAESLLRLLAAYRAHEDLISVGAYKPGSDPDTDLAVHYRDALRGFLCQDARESLDFNRGLEHLLHLSGEFRLRRGGAA